jgi:CHASE2 domain-containing sensor protein
MKMKIFSTLFCIVLLVIGCKRNVINKVYESAPVDKKMIVLVNVPRVNRCEISRLVDVISACDPKIIGINFTFRNDTNPKCDSSLQNSISISNKVILTDSHQEGSINKFSDYALLSGQSGIALDEDNVAEAYYRLTDLKVRYGFSFPFHIAIQYVDDKAVELSRLSTPLEYPIVIYYRLEDFDKIDFDKLSNVDCNLIKDKIVLLGYLGPEDEDLIKTHVTNSSSDKTYSTVIIANVILDILKDVDY